MDRMRDARNAVGLKSYWYSRNKRGLSHDDATLNSRIAHDTCVLTERLASATAAKEAELYWAKVGATL